MGWRDRDYAKWTDAERRRFYGFGSLSPRRGVLRPGAGLAALASGVIALGQLPLHHPLVPALHFGWRGSSPVAAPPIVAPVGHITGLSTASLGSTLSLHGTAPSGDGPVQIEGSYDGRRTWQALSTVQSSGGTYTAQIWLNKTGQLALKIVFANGSTAVGSIVVR